MCCGERHTSTQLDVCDGGPERDEQEAELHGWRIIARPTPATSAGSAQPTPSPPVDVYERERDVRSTPARERPDEHHHLPSQPTDFPAWYGEVVPRAGLPRTRRLVGRWRQRLCRPRGRPVTKMAPHLARPTPRLPPTPQHASPIAPGDGLLPRAGVEESHPYQRRSSRLTPQRPHDAGFSSPRLRQLHARGVGSSERPRAGRRLPSPGQARCDRAASRRSRGRRPARASLAILYRPRRAWALTRSRPLRKSGGCFSTNELEPNASHRWRVGGGRARRGRRTAATAGAAVRA